MLRGGGIENPTLLCFDTPGDFGRFKLWSPGDFLNFPITLDLSWTATVCEILHGHNAATLLLNYKYSFQTIGIEYFFLNVFDSFSIRKTAKIAHIIGL